MPVRRDIAAATFSGADFAGRCGVPELFYRSGSEYGLFLGHEAAAHEEIGFIESQSYLKPETQIKEHFKGNITDNRAFGRKTNEGIESYFQPFFIESILNKETAQEIRNIWTTLIL